MLIQPQLLEQEVLHDNKEIFARIVKELTEATFEILIASSWFTDEELFNIVKEKVAEGISVKLIIADNQENLKLDFDKLNALGASVNKIKNVGYGIMHQKFCVIDKKIALHGSYNWSVNARKNNHESIIVTNHAETVSSLVDNFHNINEKANLQKDQIVAEDSGHIKGAVTLIEQHTAKEHAILEFTKVLDSMIAAEIGNFDRNFLRKQGFDRAKFNNGDHQVLSKSLDTVYSVFINDIDIVEDKKRRLKSQIEEQQVKSINALEENLNLQLQTMESAAEHETLIAQNKLIHLESESAKFKQDIEALKVNKIAFHEKLITGIRDRINELKRNFVTPKFKWYEFIPIVLANFFLITYIFIFYSSACYILLFAVEDSKLARESGLNAVPLEIFNPMALHLTLEKGGSGILFILLFVSIPLCCALIRLFTKVKWQIISMFLVGVVLVDTSIAYKVAAAIQQMKYDSGVTDEVWHWKMAFEDVNFYLVFLLGGFGLVMLKFAFDKLILIFEERNPDIAMLQNNLHKMQLEENVNLEEERILLIKGEIFVLEGLIIDNAANIKINSGILDSLPNKLNLMKEINKTDLITGRQNITDISSIYKSHVENDHLPISIDSLNDRINIFLEGWNDYLHEEYAILKATEKSKEAFITAVSWQNEKITRSQLDKRVKS